ncbi:MAG: hypothetical protein O7G86_07355, partial [Gammaproteobacteria bacterium]|nr:hypothetical protein [Gammaproteobacteria bacterium]
MKKKSIFLTTFLTTLALTICVQSYGLQAGTVAEALANPDRPAADLERDGRSQPEAVLDHFG